MAVQVVGSVNVDIVASVERIPAPGETVPASGVERLAGGKGANQAVAAARMGTETAMIGAVGDDEAGGWMRAQLAEAGVDVAGVGVLAGAQTGTAYIAVDAAGENQIIFAAGANARLTAPAIKPGGVLLAQLETPVDAMAPLFAEGGRLRMLNAAPPVLDGRRLFGDVDVLIVNQHELAIFLELSVTPRTVEEALVARRLIGRPDQIVVVTLGAGGALAVWADRHLHVPAMPVVPVDTIGAGDCFCGALAAQLDAGVTLEAALPIANAAAALCTQVRGAAPAMPTRAAVDAFIAQAATEHAHPIKNPDLACLS
ncbi:ribokinase [Sphingomonas zeicaulis]|uniref:ribokinase n=1 Tax=Sphingomonas zeicaulis TaxID=1632740 RepID=UPI003D1B84A6